MLHNIKALYLHCVFHGIRFKVNNEDWLSGMDSLFLSKKKRMPLFFAEKSGIRFLICSKL